jgi:hypothetical protein
VEFPPLPGESPDDYLNRRGTKTCSTERRDPKNEQESQVEPDHDVDLLDLGEWDFGEDNDPIPPRGWLLGNLLCRQFLTSIFADGAVGKTALMIAMALSLATGRKLLNEHVFVRCPVILICFEDGKDELRRRLTAAIKHHNICKAEVKGYLFISAISRADAKLAANKNGEVMAGNLGAALERAIVRRSAGAVFLDPFVKTHAVGENDNMAIDFVVKILADIVIRHDCGFCSPHHTRKGPADPGNADAGRGAGSLKDAFRLCYTLNPMSEDDAGTYGVSAGDRVSLIRLDSAKVNLVRRSPNARWFKLVGVHLGNGTEQYPYGDEVQTVECWIPPDTFAQLSTSVINQIFDRIEAGPYEGGRYSPSPRATTRAAWPVVLEHCPVLNDKQGKGVIATWVKTGMLAVRSHEDKDRKKHPSLFVVKRPGNA